MREFTEEDINLLNKMKDNIRFLRGTFIGRRVEIKSFKDVEPDPIWNDGTPKSDFTLVCYYTYYNVNTPNFKMMLNVNIKLVS